MLKKLFFLNIALLCCQLVTVQAQSISPKVISSAGGSATVGATLVNYNVGEPLIGTLTGGSYQITQGFEQQNRGVNSTLLTGIISYWKLDDTTGTVAVDAAGGGNNGSNTATSQKVSGIINTGYGFNGTSSKIDVPNSNTTSSNLNLNTSGSISAWVQVPLVSPGYDYTHFPPLGYYYGTVVRKQNGTDGYNIYYDSYANAFVCNFIRGGSNSEQFFAFTGVTVTANTWVHLLITWNGTTVTTYMNGSNKFQQTQNVIFNSNTNPFTIGYSSVGTYYWSGKIDEVGIWNRVLTAKEDSLLYAAGYGNQYPFDGTANALPTANAGTSQTLPANSTSGTLTGSGTGTAITYAWTKVSGPAGGAITTPAAATTTITGLTAGTYAYQLTVTDNLGNTAFSVVNVTVNPPPTANAGPDQTLAAGTTSGTLSGSGTGTRITYSWAQIGGPLPYATIASPSSASTNISNLIAGVDTFRLTVTDSLGTTARDTVIITVNPYPTANAGTNQTVASTATTTKLSGAATGNGLTYLWSQTGGPSAGITSSNALTTPITGLTPGNTYTFLLTVTDNKGAQASSSVSVSTTGSSTLLNGLISYWNLDETTGATAFDNAGGGNNGTGSLDTINVPGKINSAYGFNGVTANSKIDMPNTNTTSSNLNLTTSGSISAWVRVPVINPNAPGYDYTDFGPLGYYLGQIVNRENSGGNGYTIFYDSYTNTFECILSSAGNATTFDFTGVPVAANTWIHLVVTWNGTNVITYMNGANSDSTATSLVPGSNANPFSIGYDATLQRNYSRGRIDEVGTWNRALTAGEVATLYNNNSGYGYPFNGYLPPTANAGTSRSFNPGTTSITLNGSGTGSAITYAWTQTAGPGGATITSPSAASTTVTGLAAGIYTFQLTVTDSLNATATSSVSDTVYAYPTANAGTSQTYVPGTTSTTLYGSGTGSGITYAWTKTAGPAGGTITSPTSASTTVTALTTGTYTFLLTVTDNATPTHNTATSSVNITILNSGGSPLITGLISYWNLNETSGSTAFDNAGGGNNGTGTLDTIGVPGKLNTAYGFNGVTANSKIDMPNTNTTASNLNLTTRGSISAWVLIPVVNPNPYHYDYTDFGPAGYYIGQVVSRENSAGSGNGYTIYFDSYSNTFECILSSGGTAQTFDFTGVTVTANTWIHLVVTWDTHNVITYMNGSTHYNSTATTLVPGSNANPFSIGYDAVYQRNYSRGRIDEVGLWNRALTAAGVDSLYNSGLGYAYPFPPQGALPVGVSTVPVQPLVTNDVNTSVTAYPNPYSTQVNFNMKTSVAGKGLLTLYDLLGRKVATVFEGDLAAGSQTTATYNIGSAKRQVLIYVFTVGDKTVQGKLIPGQY